MPPPYAFAPLELLMAGEKSNERVLDIDDEAEQLVNVLLETVKLLLLTVGSPMKRLKPLP